MRRLFGSGSTSASSYEISSESDEIDKSSLGITVSLVVSHIFCYN